MQILYIILFFIFGTIMGSFYNVVGLRLSKNESIIFPPSHCTKCNKELGFFELIPILSYIFLKGKCKNCHDKISIFYPLIEFLTGALFAVSYYVFGFTYDLGIALALSSLLSIVMVSDLNFYIIPDQVNIFFAILIFIINVLNYGIVEALKYGFYGLVMFGFMYLVMLIGNALFKQESLGGGDIKLLFVLGMSVPLMLSFFGLLFATVLAFPAALYLLIKSKDKALPFGPFLVASFLILILLKVNYMDIYTYFGIIF